MDITIITDTASIATSQYLGFPIPLNFSTSNHQFSLSDSSSDQSSPSTGTLQISAVICPVDALAPPPVKSNSFRTTSRTLLRKKRRIRRKSFSGGDSDEGSEGDDGLFGGDGPFFGGGGGGFGGSGGGGWNFDRYGGHNWDESWSSSPSDPAFDFVYEVISWIVLSNCVHFAFQKVFRIAADGIGDADREKVPLRLTSVC
ncbi:hypothetical protein CsatB_025824 [Cannabis sativa]|uniref:Uncharacterized protein n=1 Tax=Cannabis sativa TaxID=3483 RepID=A0A7J6EAY6_CANSA|nr:uncharacterized protein LOC115724187 [Cannabis sativa]KAF4346317.1 hypothetical protein G4B88_026326 [Cannabis sativa]KAF4355607.1 hypothetical protein F8388_013024 [Cannabis sativa]KAF4393639.1 hypothetical protein G4B88_007625 [Cannabis sativa]